MHSWIKTTTRKTAVTNLFEYCAKEGTTNRENSVALPSTQKNS